VVYIFRLEIFLSNYEEQDIMDKSSFKDIENREEEISPNSVKNITQTDQSSDVSDIVILLDAPRQNNQGENIMAEIVTGTTTGFVNTSQLLQGQSDIRREGAEHTSDIRREGAEHTNEIVKEGLKESFNIRGDVKDTRHDVIREVDRQADRLDGQATAFYIASQQNANEAARDLASLKTLTDANAQRYSVELALGIEKVGAASALQAEKIASAVALGQSILSKEIFHDGQKTRDLINDLKYHDLNRGMIERNTALVSAEDNHRHYRDRWLDGRFDQNQTQFAGQWAQLQSQIQAFQSQLQETRQGMVNFGTMAGVGQSSTSNNVR
jgi:hypothetical protein